MKLETMARRIRDLEQRMTALRSEIHDMDATISKLVFSFDDKGGDI